MGPSAKWSTAAETEPVERHYFVNSSYRQELEMVSGQTNRFERTYGSNGSVELEVHARMAEGWSLKFLPTLGRSRTVGIPNGSRTDLSPIPECSKMLGVPIEPADKITSLRAVKVCVFDPSRKR